MKDFTKVREAISSVDVQNDNITISAYYVVDFYDYIVENNFVEQCAESIINIYDNEK